MSQVMPYLTYPGGYSAFFADLHLEFPRWLRLVALVPLVHASIGGVSYEELCFHLLHVLPSNSSNVLVVSAERIRSSVAEMLSSEPFFVSSLPDNGPTLSTSRWIYESSFDSDSSRISFAFCILRRINLFPGWSVRDTLSGLTSVAVLPSIPISVSDESRRQEEPQLAYDGCHCMPPHSSPTAAVLVSNPSLIGPVAPQARTGLDSPNQQDSQPSALGSVMSLGPPRPREPLHPHDSVLIPLGMTASRENLHPDAGYVSTHLSLSNQTPRRFCGTTEQSGTNHHVTEDAAADSAIGAQSEVLASDFLACPDQRSSQLSAGCHNPFGKPYAKSPLFLPSQTPIRDPSARDVLSSPGSGLIPESRNMSQDSRMRRTGQPYIDRPLSELVYTSAMQHVGTDSNTDVDGALRLRDNRTLLTRTVTDLRPPSLAQCPDEPATDLSGKRGGVSHEAIRAVFPQAHGNMASSATTAPKRTWHPVTPVHHTTTLDVPFSTPIARARKILTPSPLNLRNSSDNEELIYGDQGRTHLLNPSDNKAQTLRPDRSSCTLLTPLSSISESGSRRHSSLLGTSRPSVIVYKVATGPNLAGSRDVIRVSYGDGCRKRTHATSSGHRKKERNLGRLGYPPKEYGNAKRGDTAKHLDRKAVRPKLCSARPGGYRDGTYSLRRADTKVSGKLPPAERLEGDMAWDFGAGPEKCQQRVDTDRTRVRVGGLTSVRMVPRTAADGEIGPMATL